MVEGESNMKTENSSPFSFITSDSIIKYDEVQFNVEEVINTKYPKYKEKLY